MQELMNPYIKPKHWKQLQNLLYPEQVQEATILASEYTCLSDLLQRDIMQHIDVIKGISSAAQVEYEEEQALQTIEEELRNLEFRFEVHSGD